jgi:palmitoyltransferase ZDHHC4
METHSRPSPLLHTRVPPHLLSTDTSWVIPLVIPLPYIALYILSKSDPGVITPQNYLNHIQLFQYDSIIFPPNNICRTCQIPKPARSKHCSACNVCVARLDHHCTFPREGGGLTLGIWIGNCVGYSNTYLFLLFLVVNAALLGYSTYVHWTIFSYRVGQIREVQRQTIASLGHALHSYRLRSTYQLYTAVILEAQLGGALFLICTMICLLTTAFTAHHLWLLSTGTTTNEQLKWADIKYGLAVREIVVLDPDDEYMYPLPQPGS